MTDARDLAKKALQMRLDAIMAMYKAPDSCTGSCMSVTDILVALYYGELFGGPVMKFDAKLPDWADQDYLVLSKGQAAPALYAILADLGFFDKSELDFYGQPGAMLKSRPSAKIPGVTASMLSHGHGLSVALGMALASKMDRRENRVFAVLGDGELQEGQVWEAAMAAAHYKLNNLIAIVDDSLTDIGSIQDKFESFGWQVVRVTDGHDFDQLLGAFKRAFTAVRKPVCIWCKTVTGKGVDFAEGKPNYQSVPLSEGEMKVVVSKLKALVAKNSLGAAAR